MILRDTLRLPCRAGGVKDGREQPSPNSRPAGLAVGSEGSNSSALSSGRLAASSFTSDRCLLSVTISRGRSNGSGCR